MSGCSSGETLWQAPGDLVDDDYVAAVDAAIADAVAALRGGLRTTADQAAADAAAERSVMAARYLAPDRLQGTSFQVGLRSRNGSGRAGCVSSRI